MASSRAQDHIMVRERNEDGLMIKRTEQVRYMLMSLREAYSKFKEVNSSLKSGFSKVKLSSTV